MNIYTQVCGMLLMIVLYYYFFRQRSLIALRNNRFFAQTLTMTFVSVFLDALSICAIAGQGVIPGWIVVLICKIYLCSLVATTLFSFVYLLGDVYPSGSSSAHRLYHIYIVGTALSFLSIAFLPLVIHHGNVLNDVYLQGPAVRCAYLFALLNIISSFVMIVWKKDRMNGTRRDAIMCWMAIWFAAIGVQIMVPRLLIIGFAMSLGMMILFLKLENPDTYLNQNTGLYNEYAFHMHIKRLFEKHEQSNLLFLNILRPTGDDQSALSPEVLKEIAFFLNKMKGVHVFEGSDDEYILLIQKYFKTGDVIEQLKKRFGKGWGTNKDVFVNVHCSSLSENCPIRDPEEFFTLLRYCRKSIKEYSGWEITPIDEDMLQKMRHERETEKLILDAIENNRIEVFYQPIFSTQEQKFSSAEALARIRRADGTIVPPGLFIPVAEDNGMILKIGEIVFEKVCIFLKERGNVQDYLRRIEVNLSVVQCAYEHLAEDFIRIMEKHQVKPSMINLEITESASFKAKGILLNNMHRLMDYGVRFSLDDFGTGRSNLNYIIDMPVDIVKFDRELILAYFADSKAKCVMDAAMQMIRALRLSIVSEGIEEQAQYETMESLGIDYIQGYYFSKPLPLTEYIIFLEKHTVA